MTVVEEVRKIFIKACKNSSIFQEDYEIHTKIVEKLALKLAEKFNANKEIVHLSALLHDIGRVKFGGKDHEKISAEEAEKILKELNVTDEIIAKVKECILLHRHSDPRIPELLEAKILKIADAWAHFVKPIGIVCYGVKRGFKIKESIEWVIKKLKRDLEFLERVNNFLDIGEVVKECKANYDHFISLASNENL